MMLKKIFVIVACIAITATCTASGLYWIQKPSFEVVRSWPQPNPDQPSRPRIFLNVVEYTTDFGRFPYHTEKNYFIYVGTEQHTLTYGHAKKYSFDNTFGLPEHLDSCTVQWSKEGVFFSEPSGHTLFIPQSRFPQGR